MPGLAYPIIQFFWVILGVVVIYLEMKMYLNREIAGFIMKI